MPDQDVHIDCRIGEDIAPILPDIARLRTTVFREWPYLHAGEEPYARDSLAASLGSPRAMAVLAWQGAHLVGAATGVPMADEVDALRRPFAAAGHDPREVFYFGEPVVLPGFRGRGIGVRFFVKREEHARALGYRYAAFCAVERSPADPRMPHGYVPMHLFWQNRGFRPIDAVAVVAWKEMGEGVETPKPMRFWLKDLR